MLHGAGSEREWPQIDRIILPAKAGVVPHCLRFGKPGQPYGSVALEAGNAAAPHVMKAKQPAPGHGPAPAANNAKKKKKPEKEKPGGQ